MRIEFLLKSDKKKIIERLKEEFEIRNIPYLLVKGGRGKIYGYSGNLSKEEILKMVKEINIEKIGIYLMKNENNKIRLSFDFPFLVRKQFNKNIIELSENQIKEWLKGKNIETEIKDENFVILKYKEDFFGCGKLSKGKIINFVPKERRIKN